MSLEYWKQSKGSFQHNMVLFLKLNVSLFVLAKEILTTMLKEWTGFVCADPERPGHSCLTGLWQQLTQQHLIITRFPTKEQRASR